MSATRVAVTGAGGFIGSYVTRLFVEGGNDVVVASGPPGDTRPAPAGVSRAIAAEIVDRDALESLFAGVELVVHLAGPPSVRDSFDDPTGYVRAHAEGTAAVLAACRTRGVRRFVYVSSAEVYGRPQTDPVAETHPLEARSPYAAAKIGAEQLVRSFGHSFGLASAIVRPFSVYGPGMGEHALIPAIVRQLAEPGPVRLADLRPERDYCHVEDVARAIARAADAASAEVPAFNAGSGIGVSVADVAGALVELAGSNQTVEENSANRRPGNADIMRLVADRTRALRELQWEPQIALADGLRTMLPRVRETR